MLPTSQLAGITEDLVTWYPPQAAPYVFTIAGSIDAAASTTGLEAQLQEAIDTLVSHPPSDQELATARQQLLDELVYDLETTEDAAHQLAYFAGLDALDVLLEMPSRLASVTPVDISRVAGTYLQARSAHDRVVSRRSGARCSARPHRRRASAGFGGDPAGGAGGKPSEPSPPRVVRLAGGVPVIFQPTLLSSAAYLRVLVPTTRQEFAAAASPNSPVWRHTSLDYKFRPSELEVTLNNARDSAVGNPGSGALTR